MKDEKVTTNSHLGFTKGKPFLTKAIVFSDEITGSIDKVIKVAAVYLDLARPSTQATVSFIVKLVQ